MKTFHDDILRAPPFHVRCVYVAASIQSVHVSWAVHSLSFFLLGCSTQKTLKTFLMIISLAALFWLSFTVERITKYFFLFCLTCVRERAEIFLTFSFYSAQWKKQRTQNKKGDEKLFFRSFWFHFTRCFYAFCHSGWVRTDTEYKKLKAKKFLNGKVSPHFFFFVPLLLVFWFARCDNFPFVLILGLFSHDCFKSWEWKHQPPLSLRGKVFCSFPNELHFVCLFTNTKRCSLCICSAVCSVSDYFSFLRVHSSHALGAGWFKTHRVWN